MIDNLICDKAHRCNSPKCTHKIPHNKNQYRTSYPHICDNHLRLRGCGFQLTSTCVEIYKKEKDVSNKIKILRSIVPSNIWTEDLNPVNHMKLCVELNKIRVNPTSNAYNIGITSSEITALELKRLIEIEPCFGSWLLRRNYFEYVEDWPKTKAGDEFIDTTQSFTYKLIRLPKNDVMGTHERVFLADKFGNAWGDSAQVKDILNITKKEFIDIANGETYFKRFKRV